MLFLHFNSGKCQVIQVRTSSKLLYLICGTQQLSFANDIVTSSSVIDGPSQVNVRDVTDTTALVTWFQPVAEVDGITISYGPSLNSADRTLVELTSADTQYHLGNLTPDTEYEVSLTARRGEGTSIPIYESFLTGNTCHYLV